MPIYEYECEKCKRTFEEDQKISDPKLTTCELVSRDPLDDGAKCGGPVKRLISGPASFVLKGGGWAKDGY